MVNKFWAAIEWDFQTIGINALEYFVGDPLRPWDQLVRHYMTFVKVKGSYIWAAYLEDAEAIDLMLSIPEKEWAKPEPPALFGWSAVLDRLTDLGDQLIAARARGDKVRFFPRPKLPAVELRKQRDISGLDNAIAAAQRRGMERSQRAT